MARTASELLGRRATWPMTSPSSSATQAASASGAEMNLRKSIGRNIGYRSSSWARRRQPHTVVEIRLGPLSHKHRETMAQIKQVRRDGQLGGGRRALASKAMVLERWMGAFHGRNFRLYFIGQLTSAIGTGMTPVALSFAGWRFVTRRLPRWALC